MTEDTAVKMKFGAYGAIVGAIIVAAFGFTLGGWVTESTADEMSDTAVLASRSAICVAQFMKAPNHEANLKAFEASKSWQRFEVIEAGGWDRMPGETEAVESVSRACADGLEVLLDK